MTAIFFEYFPQFLSFNQEMTPLMTFDPLSMTSYMKHGSIMLQKSLVEIGLISSRRYFWQCNHICDLCHKVKGHIQFKFISQNVDKVIDVCDQVWYKIGWIEHDTKRYWSSYEHDSEINIFLSIMWKNIQFECFAIGCTANVCLRKVMGNSQHNWRVVEITC